MLVFLAKLLPVVRLCESLRQNNECPVESIISMFSAQNFRGQHEETAENRAMIKIPKCFKRFTRNSPSALKVIENYYISPLKFESLFGVLSGVR